MSERRMPCVDCPWRKDAPKGYWHPDHFTDIWSRCQDDGYHLMLCHKSKHKTGGPKLICAGYALVLGYESIGLRLANMQGEYNPEDFTAGGIKLHPSFEAMMKAQGIKPPKRNRVTLR